MLTQIKYLTTLLLVSCFLLTGAEASPLGWNKKAQRYEGVVDQIDMSQNKIVIGDAKFKLGKYTAVFSTGGSQITASFIKAGSRVQFLTTDGEGETPMIYSGQAEISKIWLIQ